MIWEDNESDTTISNPYPDELLYSIVARYQFWSRNRSYASSVIDLLKLQVFPLTLISHLR